MKNCIALFGFLCVCSTFLSNSNGYAGSSGEGLTGAPGDIFLSNGNAKTCQFCHNTGSFNSAATLSIFDDTGVNAVTQYEAGKTYIIRLSVNAANGTPNGYGFQMIDIRKSNNENIKGFLTTQANGIKLSALPNGRVYAEHSAKSSSKIFDIKWKAPASSIGTVTFYAVGNAVNGNDNMSGDNGTASVKIDFPSIVSHLNELETSIKMTIAPNPSIELATISIESGIEKTVEMSLVDVTGKQVIIEKWALTTGNNIKTINTTSLVSGIYALQFKENQNIVSKKLIKL